MTTQIIGQSVNGVNISVDLYEVSSPVVKIFVMARQHGDEGEAEDAAQRFKDDISAHPSNYNTVSIAVCKLVNPDGKSLNDRENANARDLNRSHMLAAEPETRAIHTFIRSWKPHMVLDLHNFPSQDTYMDSIDRAYNVDCFLDKPSNPIIRHNITSDQLDVLINTIKTNNSSYKFGRYVNPSNSGRLRFSTTDLVDARNFIAFRYDCLTFILEAREALIPQETEVVIQERARESQYRVVKELVTWAKNNTALFTAHICPPVKGSTYPVNFLFDDPSGKSYTLPNVYNVLTDVVEDYTFIWFVYTQSVTASVTVPLAYAIHKTNNAAVIANLENQHGLVGIDGTSGNQYNIETIHIVTADAWVNDPDPEDQVVPDNVTTSIASSTMTNFSNYRIYNIDQDGGHVLPMLLEPLSGYGLTRYKNNLSLAVTAGTDYSILRLITKLA